MLTNQELPESRNTQVIYRNQYNELMSWIFISLLVFVYLIGSKYFDAIENSSLTIYGKSAISSDTKAYILYTSFLPSILICFIPILYKQIFGQYPFQHIREYIKILENAKKLNSKDASKVDEKIVLAFIEPPVESNDLNPGKLEVKNSESDKIAQLEKYQLLYIEESRLISVRIFNRAGAYLLAGCLIAFIGLGYLNFSLIGGQEIANTNTIKNQVKSSTVTDSATIKNPSKSIINSTNNDTEASKDALTEVEERLLNYLPRFGTLLLIEFIAFFFLKQYRITSEEYRYYEAIKRRRQDNFVLLNIIKANKDSPEVTKLFQELFAENLSLHKLNKDETTQVLETQKILNQEMDLFGKLTDLVKAVKSK